MTPADNAAGLDSFDLVQPATGRVHARVPLDSSESVDAAVLRARAAFSAWRETSPFERAARLQTFALKLRQSIPELAPILSAEGGKPVVEAEAELEWTAGTFDYYASLARSRAGRVAPPVSASGMSLVLREPIGVVAAILPWNYPILLWAWKAAPALASGNCIIAKPSPETPLSLPAVSSLLELPDDVHSIVQGGRAIGASLVAHRGVHKVAFTGSSHTGKTILRVCAERAKRCSVEMSGHDPLIVWDDVDLEVAVDAAVFAAFANAGQVCTSSERIYVRDTIFDAFRDRLVKQVATLKVGDPLDRSTDIGPLISTAHRDRVERYLTQALDRGAKIECGGKRLSGPGSYFQPTVLTGLRHEDMNALGEIFGPIAPLMPVENFEEAIRLANDNQFGLSATVLTSSLDLAMRAARDLRVGTIWINNPLMDNVAAPFGGFREAGIGRELGEEGFDAYTEVKHVSIEFALKQQHWWYAARKALSGLA